MRQYSVDAVKVAWTFAGDLTGGLAEGTFIQPRRNKPRFTQKADGVGGAVRLFTPNDSGSITLLMDGESREHQVLMTLANTDRVLQAFVAPLVITDNNTREVAFYNKAYIATPPDVPKGVSSIVIPWTFNFEGVLHQPFGFDVNVVGN